MGRARHILEERHKCTCLAWTDGRVAHQALGREPTLYENGLGFEESFIPVEICEEEGRVAGRVGQETEVLLLCMDKVRKALGDRE